MYPASFTIRCKKCNSESVAVSSYYDEEFEQGVTIKCKDCGESEDIQTVF